MSPPPASAPAPSPFEPRLLLLLGLVLWVLSAFAAVWEVLAQQPPDSPLHLGVLVTPIAQLRNYAFALGTGALLFSLFWPLAYGSTGGGRALALTLSLGSTLHVLALVYAASSGLLAVHAFDPRADARYALYVRALGHALTTGATLAFVVRLWRRRS